MIVFLTTPQLEGLECGMVRQRSCSPRLASGEFYFFSSSLQCAIPALEAKFCSVGHMFQVGPGHGPCRFHARSNADPLLLDHVQKRPEYALVVYGPPEGKTTGWLKQGGKERMVQLLGQAEPRCVSDFLLFVIPFTLYSIYYPTG